MPTPPLAIESGMTPSQWFGMNRSAATFTGAQRFYTAILERAWTDWCEVVLNGGVDLDSHGDFGKQECRDLRDFVFSDSYGVDDAAFLSLRSLCLVLNLELAEVRERFHKVCSPNEFVGKLAPKGSPRKQYVRHEREKARRRQVAMLTETKSESKISDGLGR